MVRLVLLAALALGTTSTAAAPSGRIVFAAGVARDHDLWAVAPGGGGLRRLTAGRADDGAPALSADGRRVAFTRGGDIWTLAVGGKDSRPGRVTSGPGVDRAPAWSPDGTRIVFTRSHGPVSEVWVVAAATRRARRLAAGRQPTWSPGGDAVAYAGAAGIARVAAGGGKPRLLTRGADVAPAWSPGGATIAFARRGDGEDGILLVRRDGRGLRRLTPPGGFADRPVWSRGASRIAFVARADLWTVRVADGVVRRITQTPHEVEASAAWAPDGTSWLAFVQLGTEGSRVRIISPATGRARALPRRGDATGLSWSALG
jgi:Tol biopolymer transport system component